jgi:hypothetical protein
MELTRISKKTAPKGQWEKVALPPSGGKPFEPFTGKMLTSGELQENRIPEQSEPRASRGSGTF